MRKTWEGNIKWSPDDEKSAMSMEDRRVLKLWNSRIQIVAGHYELSIPFREETLQAPNNINVAQQWLRGLMRRLTRDPGLRQDYPEEVQRLLADGCAGAVPPIEFDRALGATWYLPHHPVTSPCPEKFEFFFLTAPLLIRRVSLHNQVLQSTDLKKALFGVLPCFRAKECSDADINYVS